MTETSYRKIAVMSGLAALSAVLQLIHIGYQSLQFGMWIDFVAVAWIVSGLMFGGKVSFGVSLAGAFFITLFAPDTWLGALMKWTASFPMWFFPSFWLYVIRKKPDHYRKPFNLAVPLTMAFLARFILILPLNYFFAIPIWTGLTADQAVKTIPWFVIVIFNLIQGLLEIFLAWTLVFRFKLSRFLR